MSSRKAFRVAPSRDGVRAASTWRLWGSGDEFYVAVRDAAHASKVSFHRNGKWQLRIGAATKRFLATRSPLPGWLHAVSIQWIIFPGVLRPLIVGEEKVELLEVPEEHKLALNILLSPRETRLERSLPTEGGAFVWRQQLRNGKLLLAHAVVLPLTQQDREGAMSVLQEAPILTYDRLPDAKDVYAELAWFTTRSEVGNLVLVLPLGPTVLRGRSDQSGTGPQNG